MFAQLSPVPVTPWVISLVDGDATLRRGRQLMLRSERYDVRSYATCAAVLADPNARASSCIVVDDEMPEMGGVDLIVFTGGVGENSPETRKEVCEGLEFMGVHFDRKINEGLRGENKIISAADSKVKVAVVPTNEELVIATDTYEIVNK